MPLVSLFDSQLHPWFANRPAVILFGWQGNLVTNQPRSRGQNKDKSSLYVTLLPNHLCFLVVSGCMNTRRTSSTMARTYHSFIRSGVSILSDYSLNKAASGTCLGHHFYVSSQTLKTLISIAPFKEGDRSTVTESKTRGKSMKGHIFKLRGGEYLLIELWWCRGLFRFICSVSV